MEVKRLAGIVLHFCRGCILKTEGGGRIGGRVRRNIRNKVKVIKVGDLLVRTERDLENLTSP